MADVFAEAGARYGIPANILYGIYGTESDFGRNPSTSSAGAKGPMQFEPSTAAAMGVKNVYNLKEAVFGAARYLSQYKSRGTAGMLSAYNAGPAGGIQQDYVNKSLENAKQYKGSGSPVGNAAATAGAMIPGQPGRSVNIPGFPGTPGTHATTQLNFNTEGYQKARSEAESNRAITGLFKGGPERAAIRLALPGTMPTIGQFMTSKTTPGTPGSPALAGKTINEAGKPERMVRGSAAAVYRHPLPPDATIGRTDMGVDASMKPGDPIRAIGPGKVLGIYPNWYQGQPYLSYELTGGPHAGKVVYVAEQINPRVKPGETLTPGRIIANYAQSGTGIETGFGTKDWETAAQAEGNTGGPSHEGSPQGKKFRALLKELEGR